MRHDRLLIGAALAALASGGAAFAQDTQSPAGTEGGDEILVIGTRASNRTVTDSPVPVDVFSAEAVTQAAQLGEVPEALATLVPSFNFPRQSNSGAGDTVRAAQLRGLSPDQTLVLVNGRRYHATSSPNIDTKIGRGTTPVDLNTLPANAISRVEVLRDGAGAQYGSDAIAGVINFGLDRLDHGGSVGVSWGLNLTDPSAIGQSIADGRTWVVDAKLGTKLGNAGGFLTVGGDYIAQQGTNRAGFDEGGQFLSNGSYTDPRNDRFFGQRLFKVGDPRVRAGHLWYNAELPVGDLTLYSYGIGNIRRAEGANFFRWPVIVDGNGNDYAAPAQPNGLNGFRPVSVVNNRDVSVTFGGKGDVHGWTLDGSVTYGSNWIDYRLRDSINYSLGAASPNKFLLSKLRSDQLVANLDASAEFDPGLAGPITVATGIEYRHEHWQSTAGDLASYQVGPLADPASLGLQPGAQAGPGLTPEDARSVSRDVIAGYIEVSAQPVKAVFVDFAGRVEHYSDAGTSGAGKGAIRWELTPAIALRGSISNSFRAPTLGQIGISTTGLSFGAGGQLRRIATLPVDSPAAEALGSQRLRPETSFNLSAGVVLTPLSGLRITADAFRILIDNRITLSERFDLTSLSDAQRTALNLSTYDAINFFTNAVDLKAQGVEVVADYRTLFAGGRLNLNAGYSYAQNDIRRIAPAPVQLAQNGITGGLIGQEERNTLTTAAPRTKLILTGDWQGERFGGLVRATRFGSVTRVFDFGGGFVPTQVNPAQWSVDLEARVTVVKSVTFAVGAENLLDNYPDPSIPDINGAGNLAYDILSPIGVNGRFFYARARINF